MKASIPHRQSGIASLFERRQLRTGLLNFLYIVAGLEALIAIIALIASVGIAQKPFPWKAYFFTAFAVPVGLTFLLGIIILAFDHFYFGRRADPAAEGDRAVPSEANASGLPRARALVDLMRGIPIMLTLFAILLACLALYEWNDALAFVIQTSREMITTLLVIMGTLFAVGILFVFTWMIMQYNLHKKHMAYQEDFRQAAMEKLGVLIGEDQMPLEREDGTRLLPPFRQGDLPGKPSRPVMLASSDAWRTAPGKKALPKVPFAHR
jgi:hypothetical protein